MERISPFCSESQPQRFSRLIVARKVSTGPQALVQVLTNGLVVFPGGGSKPSDGDPIETLVREIREESLLPPAQLRALRNDGLLWASLTFGISWQRAATSYRSKTSCLDTYFLFQFSDYYTGLSLVNPTDGEVQKTTWLDLSNLAKGKLPFPGRLPANIQLAAHQALRLLPQLRLA